MKEKPGYEWHNWATKHRVKLETHDQLAREDTEMLIFLMNINAHTDYESGWGAFDHQVLLNYSQHADDRSKSVVNKGMEEIYHRHLQEHPQNSHHVEKAYTAWQRVHAEYDYKEPHQEVMAKRSIIRLYFQLCAIAQSIDLPAHINTPLTKEPSKPIQLSASVGFNGSQSDSLLEFDDSRSSDLPCPNGIQPLSFISQNRSRPHVCESRKTPFKRALCPSNSSFITHGLRPVVRRHKPKLRNDAGRLCDRKIDRCRGASRWKRRQPH